MGQRQRNPLYTARDGGTAFKEIVEDEVQGALNDMLLEEGQERSLFRLFSAKQEFPGEWHRFLHPSGDELGQHLPLGLGKQHFLSHFRDRSVRITQLTLFLNLNDGAAYDNSRPVAFSITTPDGATAADKELRRDGSELGGLPHVTVDYGTQAGTLGDWLQEVTKDSIESLPEALTVEERTDGVVRRRLNSDAIEDVGILCHYEVEG